MAKAKVSPLSSHAQFPNNPDTMPVAVYARVSTKDKGQERENQLSTSWAESIASRKA